MISSGLRFRLKPLRDDPWTETETETADNLDDDLLRETLETADWDLNNHDFRGPEGLRNGSNSMEVTIFGYFCFGYRWCLLCATTDVWSQYASEDDLKRFVVTVLRIGRACIHV